MGTVALLLTLSCVGAGAPAGRIVGRVVDEEGAPVADARVTAQTGVAQFLWRHAKPGTRTNADGRFNLIVPVAGVRYHVRIQKGGYRDGTARVLVDPTAEVAQTLRRKPSHTLSGIVRDAETGTPVGNARVSVTGEYGFSREARTDDAGHFEVGDTPDNLGQGVIIARTAGCVSALRIFRKDAHVVLSLVPEARLRGIVRDQDSGTPIAGATVTVQPTFVSGFAIQVTSGKDGRFELTGIPPGEYLVRTRHTTFYDPRQNEGHRGRIEIPLQSARVAFWPAELRKKATVTGRVLGPDGKPAAGALVGMKVVGEIYAYSGQWQVTRADTAGRFVLRTGRVHCKETVHAFSSEGGAGKTDVENLAEGEVREGVTIRLPGMMRIRGVVTDRKGAPVPGISVQPDWRDGSGDTTGADGRFDLGRVPLRPPPATECQVRFQAPRPRRGGVGGPVTTMPAAGTRFFHHGRVIVKHEPGKQVNLTAALDEAQLVTFVGTVLTRKGEPVPNAQVTLYPGHISEKAWRRQVDPDRFMPGGRDISYVLPTAWSTTDGEGRWVLPAVREETERLKAAGVMGWRDDPTHFSVGAVGPARGMVLVRDIVLTKGETRKQIDLRLGAPQATGQLKGLVVDVNGAVLGGIEFQSHDPFSRVMSGPNGRFTIPYSRDEFKVWVRSKGWSVVSPEPSRDGRYFNVRAAKGAVTAVQVVLARNGMVVGLVRWQSGRPVTTYTLSASSVRRQVSTADGLFEVKDVPVGRRTFSVQTPESIHAYTKVEVRPREAVAVEIVLPDPAYNLRVMVCDEKGAPVVGLPIRLTAKHYWAKAIPDEHGQMVFAVPPGDYELSARRGRQEFTTAFNLTDRQVGGDLVDEDVLFSVPRSAVGALRFRVVDRQGRPLAGVRVRGPRGTYMTDSAGRCEMRGLTIGRHELEIADKAVMKNESMRVTVTVEAGKAATHTLRLGHGFRIAGRVMCGQTAVRGVHLRLSSETDKDRKSFAHSEADGSFQFINLPARVTIRATPYQSNLPVTKTFDLQGDLADVTIDLPTGRIQGRVLDSHGQPWENATVRLTRMDAGEEGRRRQVHRQCEAGNVDLIYIPDGRYRLDLMDDSRGYVSDRVLDTREVTVRSGQAVKDVVLREPGEVVKEQR